MEQAIVIFGQLLAHPRRSTILVALLLSPSLLLAVIVCAGWGGQMLLVNHLRSAAEVALDAASRSGDPLEKEQMALTALEDAVWGPLRSHVRAEARAGDSGLTLRVGYQHRPGSPSALAALLSLPPIAILRRNESGGG